MNFVYKGIILLFSIFPFIIGSELDYDGWLQIRLYHALNDNPVAHFTERGNITVSSIRNGVSSIAQAGLDPSQLTAMKTLANNGNKYRLKAVIRTSSGSETTFLTSVPACHLFGTELEDILTVWLDIAGEPISVSQVSPGPCMLNLPTTKMWTTSVQIRSPDGGPTPDTASYILKVENEKAARERGETKDNRSFLAKYWMYIVPALIFVVLTSAANPDAAAGGGGGGGQRQ
ncbi:ER membrane protein complex subunit 10 [Microplitis demolitor]|uniref:ER membrane protein complex subunit 10 n=1 Tax=Microplitis demolitor TaxID=69319 RepID=UPI00235B5FA6|nr:ER membrane protein complex subunit 10 [Microplitis demolitor]